MKLQTTKIFLFCQIALVLSLNANALVTDEALIASAYNEGTNIYNLCIVKPPATPDAVATCTGLYSAYTNTLSLVNAPLPIVISLDPSPYSSSPFDICRYETAHMVFNSVLAAPYYCPTV